MTPKRLTSKRLILEYESKREMNLANFRISEFSEGKEGLRFQYSTPDQFIDAYSDEELNLDYWWDGFNYSKDTLLKFIKTYSKQLSKREIEIAMAADIIDDDGYVVAIVTGDNITLKHELAHGYYFDTPLYRKTADEIISQIPQEIIDKLKQNLLDINYTPEVLQDEIHAYLTAYDKCEWKELFNNIKLKDVKKHIKLLDKNFKSFHPTL